MPRTPVWKSIARSLIADIAEGRYSTGDRLPTEAQLSATFGVNRHTVRRALGSLAEQGLVHSRRGAGVFVAARPTDYALGRRVRFHQNIRATGQTPAKEILALTTRAADAREANALDLTPGDPVHVFDGLSLADGQTLAVFQSIFPGKLLDGILEAISETTSVTAALARCGIPDFTRISTRITAKLASPTLALHLQIEEGAPILRTEGINVDPGGVPVEFGRSWFAGDRVTLTLDDP